uniref:fimbrial protein n=1 Tax=Hafnia alvei TaxID=569 RepID=UPI00242BA90A|nr:fimbrial protein [Hafnia alvei]
MKFIYRNTLALSLCLYSAYSMAIDGTIDFTGDINSNTCSVSVKDGNGNAVVNMGSVQASSLKKANDIAGGSSFTVNIEKNEDCDLAGKTGTIRFTTMSGTAGDKQQYLALKKVDGVAENVAIRITDANDNLINIGSDTTQEYDLTKPIRFTANYIATGAATAGKADAKAGFVITYK